MANAIYPKFKQSQMTEADTSKSLDQTTANIAPWLALVSILTYTYSSSHQFYSSLSGIVGTDMQLTTPTVVNGTFDADDVTFTSVTGAAVGALVGYRKNAGANTTWRLFLYEDTSVTGLPVTPNGGNIVVTWNASGILTESDRRSKTNIVQVGKHDEGSGGFGVYEYHYAGLENAGRCRGLIAQEVQARLPHCVAEIDSPRGNGRRLAVHYGLALAA